MLLNKLSLGEDDMKVVPFRDLLDLTVVMHDICTHAIFLPVVVLAS